MANILIVDDQRCIRQLLADELALEGYQVTSARNEQSVREHFLSTEPDVVILDLYLEGPEGFGLFEDMKAEYPDLPIIVHTAYDTFRDDPRLSQADGYVIKSIDLWKLKQEIAKALKRRGGLQRTGQAREILSPSMAQGV